MGCVLIDPSTKDYDKLCRVLGERRQVWNDTFNFRAPMPLPAKTVVSSEWSSGESKGVTIDARVDLTIEGLRTNGMSGQLMVKNPQGHLLALETSAIEVLTAFVKGVSTPHATLEGLLASRFEETYRRQPEFALPKLAWGSPKRPDPMTRMKGLWQPGGIPVSSVEIETDAGSFNLGAGRVFIRDLPPPVNDPIELDETLVAFAQHHATAAALAEGFGDF